MGMNMDQYTPEFTAKGVDGQQLLNLDSDKLKVKEKHTHTVGSTILTSFPMNMNDDDDNWLGIICVMM